MITINYIEKGRGLHDKIELMGYKLQQQNGEWVADNPSVVQVIIDNYTLNEAKNVILRDIDMHARQFRDYIVSAISPAEMASWPIKREEAMVYVKSGKSSVAPNLAIEATQRQMPLVELVGLVIKKGHQFSHMESMIAGTCGYHQDQVRTFDTFMGVLTYDWTVDWPNF